jgi:type IV pilus assembly protein PilW
MMTAHNNNQLSGFSMRHRQNPLIHRVQIGVTLIELLVALGLGILLVAGVGQIFITSRQTQRLEQSLSQVQDTGRYALDIIGSDIRQAGHYGCLTPAYEDQRKKTDDDESPLKIIAKDSDLDEDTLLSQAITAYSRSTTGTFSPSLPTDLTSTAINNARNGSDIIRVFYALPETLTLTADHVKTAPTANLTFNVTGASCPQQNSLMMIANCGSAHMFQITNEPNCSSGTTTVEHTTAGNDTNEINAEYKASESFTMRFVDVVYFVADTGRTGADGQPVFALYRRVNNETAEELLEGVEYLKAELGQLLDSGNIRYIAPGSTGLKDLEIVSARVGVLAKNSESVMGAVDTNSYELPGGTISNNSTIAHSGGRVLRKAFISTFKIRNRNENPN